MGESFGRGRLPGAQKSVRYTVGAHCKRVERMDEKNEQDLYFVLIYSELAKPSVFNYILNSPSMV